jgi:hypothetical protein
MANLIKRYPVVSFYIVALLLGAIFTAPFIASTLGLISPLPFVVIFGAAFSASLAAVIVTAIIGGWAGVKALLSKFLIWRFGVGWWLATLLLPIVPVVGGLLLNGLFGGRGLDASQFQPLSFIVPYLLIKTIQAGVGEEFGWRGFALPRLQRRHNALVSSIIVGVMHGLWHVPLYFADVGMPQYTERLAWGFVPALLLDTAMVIIWSILYTWLYNNSKGSVLRTCVFHAAIPTWTAYFGLSGGLAGTGIDLSAIVWFGVLFAVMAIAVIVFYGPKHLSRKAERQTA